jgi:hypothetical protein
VQQEKRFNLDAERFPQSFWLMKKPVSQALVDRFYRVY